MEKIDDKTIGRKIMFEVWRPLFCESTVICPSCNQSIRLWDGLRLWIGSRVSIDFYCPACGHIEKIAECQGYLNLLH
jgi:predicted RNA-binding Zn-ribbon protein involved in translation (DUF1610 family)